MKILPIFIISLPRSGSTFLQKILMSHADIASAAEPWFLLPLIYMNRTDGIKTEYGHTTAVSALNHLASALGNDEFHYEFVREAAESVYRKFALNGERYFLDKTPRYYLILNDLIKCFPNAKFIVLLRNPISIFASSIEAFQAGKARRLDHLHRDFYLGPKCIAEFVENHKKQLHLVRYEDLVSDTSQELEKICKYLGIAITGDLVEKSFKVELNGLGDNIGAIKYKKVMHLEDKWKNTVNTMCRKWRLKKYLNSYPNKYLDIGGYDKKTLLNNIKNHRPPKTGIKEFHYFFEELIAKAYKKICRSF